MSIQTLRRRGALLAVFLVLIVMQFVGSGCILLHRSRGVDSKSLTPPAPQREFRAAWVATVKNIDWPSKAGLSTADQQKEMTAILDRAVELKLNAIVLQVRTSADALYDSKLEPWSEFLTGKQGERPDPFWDPLAVWVDEAHRRGLELHAWFNPFRAGTPGRGEDAANHIGKQSPKLVKQYGEYLWLDPGEEEAQKHTLAVFLDVVKRYDIDGVHIDDYFYPYPITDKDKKPVEFPDDPSWDAYTASGGKLSRADWRRENINHLIHAIYDGTKKLKPYVQFGISPFGISRPGNPPTVKTGFNQYDELYADAKLWLNKGWCDYFTPQLYWGIHSEQPYADLLNWWANENTQGRHLWPGLFTSRIGDGSERAFSVGDVIDQIYVTRDTPGATGHVHFSMKALMRDAGAGNGNENDGERGRGRRRRSESAETQPTTTPSTSPTTRPRLGIAGALEKGPYAEPALVPASPWLDKKAPPAPKFNVTREDGSQAVEVSWQPQNKKDSPRVWVVHAKHNAAWTTHVYAPHVRTATLQPDEVLGPVTAVSVSAVDRSGNESTLQKAKLPGKAKTKK